MPCVRRVRAFLGTPIQTEGRRAWPSCSRPWGPPWWRCALACAPSVTECVPRCGRPAAVPSRVFPGGHCHRQTGVRVLGGRDIMRDASSCGTRPLLSLRHVSPARPASSLTLLRSVFPLAVPVGEDPTGGVGSDGKSRHLHEGPAFRHLRCGTSTAECLIPTGVASCRTHHSS